MKTKLMTIGGVAVFYLLIMLSVVSINNRLKMLEENPNQTSITEEINNVAYNQ